MGKTIKAADLFCGAGGASVGFRRACKALGLDMDLLAINHWTVAVETHSLNHPDVRHMCESIERINPRDAVPSGRLQLLIAAPECTHHSTARGGRPINDQSRATAWHILKWAQELYIDNILIENVPEFREWGPIGANGRPLKSRKGETFRAFLEALRSLGYTVDHRVLNAADYGDPTTRRRMFIMARRAKGAINWPQPTHSRSGHAELFGKMKKWRAAREVIDWDIKGQSIFDRKRPLSPKTVARIMAGLERFGGEELKPFLIVLRRNLSARSLDAPLPTLCAGGQHVGLVEPTPFLVPVTHGGGHDRAHTVDEPVPTITCAHRGELAVVEPFVLQQQSGGVPRNVSEPLPTIATDGAQMLVEPFMISAGGPKVDARPVSEPMNTVLTRDHMALVEAEVKPAFIARFNTEKDGREANVHSLDEPLGTIPTENRFGVVEPFVVQVAHGTAAGDTEHRRAKSIDEPLGTLTTENQFAVCEPFLVPHYGERPGQPPRTHSVDEPVPTIPASGDGKFEVVQPFIVPPRGFSQGAKVDSVDQPLRTIVAASGHNFAVVEPQVMDESFIASYYGTQNISPVSDPLPTVTTKDRFALVMPVVNGKALDIRLRMLKPHELAKAMSFDEDYQFAGTQGDKVKQIGNAWPCSLGQALIQALLEPYAARKRKQNSKRTNAVGRSVA